MKTTKTNGRTEISIERIEGVRSEMVAVVGPADSDGWCSVARAIRHTDGELQVLPGRNGYITYKSEKSAMAAATKWLSSLA
jgi:hypothetical protein